VCDLFSAEELLPTDDPPPGVDNDDDARGELGEGTREG